MDPGVGNSARPGPRPRQSPQEFPDLGQQLRAVPTHLLRGAIRVEDLLEQLLHARVTGHLCKLQTTSRLHHRCAGINPSRSSTATDLSSKRRARSSSSLRMCWFARPKNSPQSGVRAVRMALSSRSSTVPSILSGCGFNDGCVIAAAYG